MVRAGTRPQHNGFFVLSVHIANFTAHCSTSMPYKLLLTPSPLSSSPHLLTVDSTVLRVWGELPKWQEIPLSVRSKEKLSSLHLEPEWRFRVINK